MVEDQEIAKGGLDWQKYNGLHQTHVVLLWLLFSESRVQEGQGAHFIEHEMNGELAPISCFYDDVIRHFRW